MHSLAELRSSRPFRKALGAVRALAALAGGWVLYTFPPAQSSFYPRCVFHAVTGLDCPGCGTTRALHHLLHGRVGEAWHFNPMLFVLMAVALFALPSLIRGEVPRFTTRPWFGWTAAVVVIGWGIVRNLPLHL